MFSGTNVEIVLAHSTNLLQRFRYPWDMLTLMYVTVKYAGANLDEALRRIEEGEIYDLSIIFRRINLDN